MNIFYFTIATSIVKGRILPYKELLQRLFEFLRFNQLFTNTCNGLAIQLLIFYETTWSQLCPNSETNWPRKKFTCTHRHKCTCTCNTHTN